MVSCALDSQLRYRLGYLLTSFLLVVLTVNVPNTILREKCSEFFYWGEICDNVISKAALLLVYGIVIFSFFLVQGSDPGYIVSDSLYTSSDYDHHEEFMEYPHDCSDETTWQIMTDKTNCHEKCTGKDFGDSLVSDDTKQNMHSDGESAQAEPGMFPEYPRETGDNHAYTDSSTIERTHNPLMANNTEEKHPLLPSGRNNAPFQGSTPSDLSPPKRKFGHQEYKPGGPEGPLHNRNANSRNLDGKRRNLHWNRNGPLKTLVDGEKNNGIIMRPPNDTRYEDYCRYCDMSVPLRSHHCNKCQRCVATFDHHCLVIGTCIGEKNHCRFYVFIFINFVSIWLISYIVDTSFEKNNAFEKSHPKDADSSDIAYLSSITLGILWWYVLLLLLYQTWLVCSSTTGYECLKMGSSPVRGQVDDLDTCDSPYGGKYVSDVICAFCCIRDGAIYYLKGAMWKPTIWKKNTQRTRIEDTEVCDNFCRNKYYSCC